MSVDGSCLHPDQLWEPVEGPLRLREGGAAKLISPHPSPKLTGVFSPLSKMHLWREIRVLRVLTSYPPEPWGVAV